MNPIVGLLRAIKHGLQRVWLGRSRVVYGDLPGFSGQWPLFNNSGTIELGVGCRFRMFRVRSVLGTGEGGNIRLGDHVMVNDGCNFYSEVGIDIGADTMIGDMVTIYDTSCHELSPQIPAVARRVRLGRNVWVGARAIILPGVTIGDHAVIGAGAVVTKDVPTKSVAVGNPARVIKTFDCASDWIRH
jgi:acetyltransferase-like isoleucine patch superfamily enzyme